MQQQQHKALQEKLHKASNQKHIPFQRLQRRHQQPMPESIRVRIRLGHAVIGSVREFLLAFVSHACLSCECAFRDADYSFEFVRSSRYVTILSKALILEIF